METKKELGNAGEDLAAKAVEEKGYSILDRNFRFGKYGEIDIIARKGNVIAFIEVKYRRGDYLGGPLYSMPVARRKRMKSVARYFIQKNVQVCNDVDFFRFDLVYIEGGEVVHLEDMFR